MKTPVLIAFASLGLTLWSAAAPPVVSNVRASQRPGTKFVDVQYDIADPDSAVLTVQIEMSSNSGQAYDLPLKSLSGHVGFGVTPGANRVIFWDAGKDWNGNFSPNCRVRIWAFDNSAPVPPPGMVFIPSGTFRMGYINPQNVGGDVTLSKGYFMDRYELSGAAFTAIRNYALQNGYGSISGTSRAADQPAYSFNWYDALRLCNARSEMEGLVPCYYTDAAHTLLLKTGNFEPTTAMVKWDADGYRLPTEAEWERAARGGLDRKVYPWGDTIAPHQANYSNSGDPFESGVPHTTPVGYYNGLQIPPGLNMANDFGLYDVAGNVSEWCWDYSGGISYGQTDPLGPSSGALRVTKGASAAENETFQHCANRRQSAMNYTTNVSNPVAIGIRCVRKL